MSTTQIQKTNPTPTTKPSALAVMAARVSVDPAKLLDTLKATVFKNASNEELLALVVVANTYDLNPFLKEIYAFPAKGGGIVPIVGVDGWNKMLIRQPDFDGIKFDFADDQDGKVYSCTATVFLKNRTHPVILTEYFDECHRNTDPWNNMPRRMLRNRTLCQAARVAFGFSGIHDEDEAATVIATSGHSIIDLPKVIPTKTESSTQSDERAEAAAGLAPNPPATDGPQKARTLQSELEAIVIEGGFNLDSLLKWGAESGNIEGADSIASFDEIPTDVCKRLIRAKTGLLKGLGQTK